MKTKEEIMQMIWQRLIEIDLLKEILNDSQLIGRSKSKGADIIPDKGKLGIGLTANKTNLSPREPAVKKKKRKPIAFIGKIPKRRKVMRKGSKLTEEIIQYIKDNWKKKTDKILAKSIKEEFGVKLSDNTIKKKRHRLGLIKIGGRKRKKLKYKDNINELAKYDVDDENLEEE